MGAYADLLPDSSDSANTSSSVARSSGNQRVDAFVEQYRPIAERVAEQTGNDPELYLAKWGLETGWGKSIIPGTNNLGNIKDFSGSGVSAKDNATGSADRYRQYKDANQFADDYASLLNRRYKNALNVGSDMDTFATELKRAGYAEDPNYVSKLKSAYNMLGGSAAQSDASQPSPNAHGEYEPRTDYSAALRQFDKVPNDTYEANRLASTPKGMSISKEISAAIDSYQANLWSIPAAMGSEYALNAMLENKSAAEQQWADSGAPQSFSEMEFGKNFGQYFAHMAIQSAPYMLEFIASGFGVGSLAKGALANTAKGVAEKAAIEAAKQGATKEAAKKAGEVAAKEFMGTVYTASGVAGSYPSAVGDVLSNQYEQSGKFNLPAAAALGVPYAALNAAGAEGMLTRGLARGLPKTSLTAKGAAGFAGRAALTGAEAGLMEGSTETGQEVMNQLGRMAVDPDAKIDDKRALEAYKESFIAGGLLGGVPGAVAGGFRKPEDAKLQPPAPVANSPLSNAAQAAQAADPITEALKPISERFADRALYEQIRNHPNLGPDAMTQILSAYRVATNSNMDPMARQAAVDRLGEFFRLFDNQPNFTAGRADAPGVPAVVGNKPSAVGPVDPRVGAIDGEASRVAPNQQQGMVTQSAPALATDERARKAAEAEYEAAYQDLVKAEQLGASDQELMQRQIAMRNAEARLQEINDAIESNRAKETAEKRGGLLDRVLASNPENPNRAFDRALRLEGFRDSTFTEEEKSKIARFNELRNIQEDGISSAPNEAGDFGIREKRASAPAGRYQHLADMLSSGWQLANRHQLTGPNGEVYNLKGAGEAQFVRNKLNQKAGNGNQSPLDGSQGGTDQGDNGVGSAGANGPVPQGGGNGSGQANAIPDTDAPAGAVSEAEATGAGNQPNNSLARSRLTALEDQRVAKYADELRSMAPDSGWAEEGGRLLIAPDGTKSRTKWIPRAEWFIAGMLNSPQESVAAVEKAISGQPMRKAEKLHVQGMMDFLDMQYGIDGESHAEQLATLSDIAYEGESADAQNIIDTLGDVDLESIGAWNDEVESMRALGFTEEEINEITRRKQGAFGAIGEEAAGVPAGETQTAIPEGDGNGNGQAEGQEGFSLDQQTNEEAAAEYAQQQAGEPGETPEQERERIKKESEIGAGSFSLEQEKKPESIRQQEVLRSNGMLFGANGQPTEAAKSVDQPKNQEDGQELADELNRLNPQLRNKLTVKWVDAGDDSTQNHNGGESGEFMGGHNGSTITLVRGKADKNTLLHELRHMVDMLLGGYELRKWLKEDGDLFGRMVSYLKAEREAGRIDKHSRMTDAEETAQSVLDAYYRNKEVLRADFPDVVAFLEQMGADKYAHIFIDKNQGGAAAFDEKARESGVAAKQPEQSASFDSESWDKARESRIKASKQSGAKHLDNVPVSVESMRGKEIYYVHDHKQRGVIRTVDNRGNVYIYWSDKYSAEKELASESIEDNKAWLKTSKKLPYMRTERNGKTYVFQSSIGASDLKDYVLAGSGSDQSAKPAGTQPVAQRSFVRTYKTKSGKIGARIEKVVGPTGKVFYNYTGEWGAGSGHALAQMDKIESMWRKEKRGYTVVEADAAPETTTAEDKLHTKDSEKKSPATLDEFIGAVDAGYRAHYDYSGADGSTVWIEKTEVSGQPAWVMKWIDDDHPGTTQTKGGAGLNVWDKLKALRAVEDKVKYRFTEWKPVAESAPSPVNTSMRDTGAKAFADGLPRVAPEGIKGADKVRWLTGYDTAKNGGRERHELPLNEQLEQAERDLETIMAGVEESGYVEDARATDRIARQEKLIKDIKAEIAASQQKTDNRVWNDTEYSGVQHDTTSSPVRTWRYKGRRSEAIEFAGSELLPEYPQFYRQELVDSLPADLVEYVQGEVRKRLDWYDKEFGVIGSDKTPLAPPVSQQKTDEAPKAAEQAAPESQPENDKPAYADDAELQDALSHLGDVLGDVFGAKLNITGKQYGASDLLPAMSKVIELLIKRGFKSFRESVGAATNAMRGNERTSGFVDQITPRQWKAAYNSVAEFHEGTESEEDVAKYSAEQIQKIIALPEKIKEAEQATNHDATPGQKEAGNYAKGKFAWHGLNIAVETAKGEDRTDKETNGEKWRVTMPATYGYILGTVGADKDHVDVFIGDKPESQRVYVVNQTKPGSTEFDEHKIMLGYESEGAAIGDYLLSFSDTFGASVLGSVSGPYAIDDFKHMLESNRFSRAKPISDRLAYVNPRVEEKPVEQQPPGVKTNGTKEKAAAERLAQLLDKMDQVRIDRNTPEGSAKGIVRSVIEELRKERTAVSVSELLETASQRLSRQHAPFSEVIDQVVESLRSDVSPVNKGDIKQADVSLDKFGLTVRRSQTKNGTPTWEVSGNTRDHVAALRNAGGKWYGPKKVWSFYSEESPEGKILAALGASPDASEIALSDIEVERKSDGPGRIKTYTQRADEALSEIDEKMSLGKQLLECLNS